MLTRAAPRSPADVLAAAAAAVPVASLAVIAAARLLPYRLDCEACE